MTEYICKAQELKASGLTIREIARELFPDVDEDKAYYRVQRALHRATASHNKQNHPYTVEGKADGTTTFSGIVELSEGEPVTPEAIMKAHKIDASVWDVVSYKSNYWQAQTKGNRKMVLYQSKITVKPKKSVIPTMDEIRAHFELFEPRSLNRVVPVRADAERMLEVNIADLHLGKMAWAPEAGESYDYKIAKARFYSIIEQEVARAQTGDFEEILFVWSNDFFNSDGISNSTTAGTPQDDDLRWNKMFLVGCELLVEAITALSKYAPVRTFLIASNHSRQAEFYAINYLAAWFRDDPAVTVDINCRPRYYYRYGVNLIGFTHGSYEKPKNLPHLMSVEAPELWAETRYREFHIAHLHSEQVKEEGGIVFRWLPSVTGPDAWHSETGYLGAFQRSYSFIWGKNTGLEGINVVYPYRTQ